MDTKKFEQLIQLYLNEGNEEKARALFHDIIVEKSREIYESMLDMEEGAPMDEMIDNLEMEESGMNEDDTDEGMYEADDEDMDMDAMDDMEGMDDMGDEEDMDDMGDMDDADMDDTDDEEGDLEDRVVDIEDKLDQLMSEFEELMGKEEGAEDDEDMAADDEEAADDEMDAADDEEEAADDEEDAEEEMMESVSLHTVKKPTPGDSGVNTRSVGLHRPLVDERGVPKIGGGSAAGGRTPAVKSSSTSYGNSPTGNKRLKEVGKVSPGEQPRGTSPVAKVTESRKPKAAAKPAAKRI